MDIACRWCQGILAALVVSLSSVASAATADPVEARVALIIGNGGYRSSPLPNPVNDARDMAMALKELGFMVIERFDATQKEMNRAIVEFGGKLRTGTVALFYFAGHGLQVRGKNYLVPIDAEITAEASIRAEAVDVDTVIDQLAASDLSVVILDACRNNPYERRFRGIGGGLAQMEAPKGSLIAYATAPGMTAFDGSGRNGLYTSELLKEIRKRGQPIEGVFKNVRRNVAKATRDQQVPWESSSLIGDFYFNPVVISVETKPEIPVAQPAVVSPPSVAATAIKTEPEAKAERKTETVKTDVAKASGASRPEPSPAAAPALGVVAAQTARVETKPETPVAQPAAGAPPSVATMPIKADAQVKVAPEPKAGTKAEAIRADAVKASGSDSPKAEPSPAAAPVPGVVALAAPSAIDRLPTAPATAKTSVTPLPARQPEEAKPTTRAEPSGKVQERSPTQPYTLPRGARYEGEWKDGKPAGRGQFFYESGDRYSGEVVDGQKHGHGRMTWARGGFWEGGFANDRQVLDGQMLVQSGDMTMEGRFAVDAATGRATGSGKLTWTNGDVYEGALVRGVKHGSGSFRWSDGQRYTGQWADNVPNGQGALAYANGDSYEGALKDGEPHGQGTYRLSNGDIYTGAWERGLKHGHGRLTWASGGAWEGEFRNDKQTDRGHMVAGVVVAAKTAKVETKPETPVAQPAAGAPPNVATTPIKAEAQVKAAPEPKAGTKAEAIRGDAVKASGSDSPKPEPSPPAAPVPGVVAAAVPSAIERERPPEAPATATAKTSVTSLPARQPEEAKLTTRSEPSGKAQERSATGPYALPRGVRYEGEWRDGKPAGRGQFFYENGDRYSGEVVDGQRHGHGRITWARGGFWEGKFVNDRQVLDGQMLVQSGDMTMEGRFAVNAAGRPTGSGRLTWTNGDSYEGEVKDGEPHGQGTYRLSNGDTYAGAWERGLKHGHGRLTWARGGAWEGEFRNDQQTERGHMVAVGSGVAAPAGSTPQAEHKVVP